MKEKNGQSHQKPVPAKHLKTGRKCVIICFEHSENFCFIYDTMIILLLTLLMMTLLIMTELKMT